MKKFTFKVSFLLLSGMFALTANAQQTPKGSKKFGKPFIAASNYCGTVEYEEQLSQKNPERAKKAEFEEWIAPKVAEAKTKRLQKNGNGTNEVVTIPMVFHVIHNGDAIGENENISDEQILSQIQVLNEDYRRAADTPGFNSNPVGADMEIEFCLAKRTPNGLPSSGIVRYNIGDDNGWQQEEVELIKAQTQWDPEKYLNIWIVEDIFIPGGYLAGYAQFPTQSGLEGLGGQTSTANTDGVALGARYVGSVNYYAEGTYDEVRNMGRSASHEIGHFFGLRHIWGDTGDCATADDYCDDTPTALNANYGCQIGIDSCPESEGLDMIENYMDYTDDVCLNTFTQDQKDRMQAVLANSPRRKNLPLADSCTPGTASLDNDGAIYLLPFSTNCSNDFSPVLSFANRGTNTITSAVINYMVDDAEAITYTWTGSLAPNEDTRIELPAMGAQEGEHTFTVAIQSINGGADALASNNTRTNDFSFDPIEDELIFDTETVTITVQTDDAASEVTWLLMDSDQNTIAYGTGYEDTPGGVLDVQEVEVNSNSCYAFIIIDAGVDGIPEGYYSLETSDGTIIKEQALDDILYADFAQFGVNIVLGNKEIEKTLNNIVLYPNPANNILNIAVTNGMDTPDSYIIYNSLGQIMDNGIFTSSLQTLDITNYSNGVYFVKLGKDNQAKTLQFVKY